MGTGHNASYSYKVFLLERCSFLSLSEEPKSPLLCTVSPYLYERRRDFSFSFLLWWWFCQSSLLPSFYGGFSLPFIVLSLSWDGPPDIWHWVDGWCHCSCKVFSFYYYVDRGCKLPSCVLLLSSIDLIYGQRTFADRERGRT